MIKLRHIYCSLQIWSFTGLIISNNIAAKTLRIKSSKTINNRQVTILCHNHIGGKWKGFYSWPNYGVFIIIIWITFDNQLCLWSIPPMHVIFPHSGTKLCKESYLDFNFSCFLPLWYFARSKQHCIQKQK